MWSFLFPHVKQLIYLRIKVLQNEDETEGVAMCEKPRRLKMFAIMVVVVLLVAVTVAIPRIARAEDGVVASDVNIEEDDVEVLDVAAEEDDVIASDSTTEELEPANATDEAALLVADTTNPRLLRSLCGVACPPQRCHACARTPSRARKSNQNHGSRLERPRLCVVVTTSSNIGVTYDQARQSSTSRA